ncbi:hypothetical protein DX980_18355 [Burkholderia gladioli]|nr:hypothetical protein LvStA_03582 [Burkholderia gladioli]WAG21032.1 hypothetical protein DX980_18355 [Burkholderia gladioli]
MAVLLNHFESFDICVVQWVIAPISIERPQVLSHAFDNTSHRIALADKGGIFFVAEFDHVVLL